MTAALATALLAEQPGLTLLDAPGLPRSPIFPNRTTIALLGLQAGLALGLLAGFFQRKPQRL